ncbi:MAG: V-type ATPase 116kDa subunit family protein, partial [Bdellovibrio bacteriovorus]
MPLRPFAAQWFEVVVPKTDADDTMEALARHAEVQFEWQGDPQTPAPLDPLHAPLARYRELAAQYGRFWPAPGFPKRCCDLPLETEARLALNRIERWLVAARDDLDQQARLLQEQALLDTWQPVLDHLRDSEVDLGGLAGAGPALGGLCLVLPPDKDPPGIHRTLTLDVPAGDRRVRLLLAPKTQQERLAEEARALGGRVLTIPPCFRDQPRACARHLANRRGQIARQLQQLERDLRQLAAAQDLDRSLGVLQRIDWFLHTARDIQCDDQVCWITGWTNAPDRSMLEGALKEVGVEAPVAFMDPPTSAPSPSVTDYPLWLQPFEVFTRAVGVPGLREADPTTWVALLVPLLFGYMCGDVGHGLVILAAALLLRR